MRPALLSALVVAGSFCAGGCAVTPNSGGVRVYQQSPKELIPSYERAIRRRRWEHILIAVEPALRRHVLEVLEAYACYRERKDQVDALVRERIGHAAADALDETMHSWVEVTLEGVLLWHRPPHVKLDSMRFDVRGELTHVLVGGEDTGVVVRRVDDRWYIHFTDTDTGDIASFISLLRHLAGAFGRIERGIRNGEVTDLEGISDML